MSEVLDREMPREKKRRFFWLLPVNAWLLLTTLAGLAAGAFFLTHSNAKHIAERSAPLKTSAGAAHSVPMQPMQKAVAPTPTVTPSIDEAGARTGQPAGHPPVITDPRITTNAETKIPVIKDSRMKSANVQAHAKKANSISTASNKTKDQKHSTTINNTQVNHNTTTGEASTVSTPSSNLNYWPNVKGNGHAAYHYTPPVANGRRDVAPRLPRGIAHRGRGFSAGVGVNMEVPVGKQERSNVGFNGKKGTALDYLPSVFVQYHFNNRLSLRTGLQWMAPQYVRQYNMYEQYSDAAANHYREDNITLRKLYYLTVPLTVQYKLSPRIQIGGGLEYARLKRSLFENEACLWQQDAGNWWKPWQDNSMSAVNSKLVNDDAPNATPLDTAAYSIKRTDWRLQLNASYQWKRLELGVQASSGISPYVNTTQKGYYNTPVRAVNRSLQFYLHYTLFNRRSH